MRVVKWILAGGTVVGLIGHGWFVLEVGGGILLLRVVIWLFPFLQATLRVAKLQPQN